MRQALSALLITAALLGGCKKPSPPSGPWKPDVVIMDGAVALSKVDPDRPGASGPLRITVNSMNVEENGAVTDTSGFVNTSSAPIDVGYLVPILSENAHDFQVTFDGAPVSSEILGVEAAAELCRRERERLGAEAFLRFPNKRHLRFQLGTITPLGEHVVIMRYLEPAQQRRR